MARPVNDADGESGTVGPERSREWFIAAHDAPSAPHPDTAPEPGSMPVGAAEGRGRHAAPARSRRRGRGRAILRWTTEVVAVVLVAVLGITLIRVFVAQPFYVPSAAMEPALSLDDRVLAASIATNIGGVQRGQVVTFTDPGGWLPPRPPDEGVGARIRSGLEFIGVLPADAGSDMILRVIGIGGDRVACCDEQGQIELNGVPLIEPYLAPGVPTDQVEFDVIVPEGGLFVMGDNRAQSLDSRAHLGSNSGSVPVDNVVGRVVFVLWPLGELGPVGVPSTFNQVPPAPTP